MDAVVEIWLESPISIFTIGYLHSALKHKLIVSEYSNMGITINIKCWHTHFTAPLK